MALVQLAPPDLIRDPRERRLADAEHATVRSAPERGRVDGQ